MAGLCECGCGREAPIATRTDARKGAVKGEPRRFIQGHSGSVGKGRRLDLTDAYTVDAATDCWLWQRSIHHTGYASIGRSYGGGSAHRYFYELHRGPVPDGMHLDHVRARGCQHRHCVNPDHLEPVSNAENCRRGANAKLTHAQVREVKGALAVGATLTELAKRYGVSLSTIWCINAGKTWVGV